MRARAGSAGRSLSTVLSGECKARARHGGQSREVSAGSFVTLPKLRIANPPSPVRIREGPLPCLLLSPHRIRSIWLHGLRQVRILCRSIFAIPNHIAFLPPCLLSFLAHVRQKRHSQNTPYAENNQHDRNHDVFRNRCLPATLTKFLPSGTKDTLAQRQSGESHDEPSSYCRLSNPGDLRVCPGPNAGTPCSRYHDVHPDGGSSVHRADSRKTVLLWRRRCNSTNSGRFGRLRSCPILLGLLRPWSVRPRWAILGRRRIPLWLDAPGLVTTAHYD